MTYREPARTTTRRTPRILVAGLLVAMAAIAAALGYRLLASSSSTAASLVGVLRNEHRGAPGKALPNTVWPAHGQAAFVQTGQLQIQASPEDRFVGVKTGSDDAAGGCFAFRAIRWIDGKRTTITGVVLGQPGHNQITAGLAAADAMVDRIASH